MVCVGTAATKPRDPDVTQRPAPPTRGSGVRVDGRRQDGADPPVGGRVGRQKPPRPSAGSAPAVIQRMEGGSQFQREAVVCDEPVGGELALPADRSVNRGTE